MTKMTDCTGQTKTGQQGQKLAIVVDSREQCPFPFDNPKYQATVQVGTLQTGDYSLAGLTDKIAVERKSLPDLVQCLGRDRERFVRELERAQGLKFAIVCEGSLAQIAKHEYQSQLDPHAAIQSIAALTLRFGVPFFFGEGRRQAEYFTWSFLYQFQQDAVKRLKTIARAGAA